MNPICDETYYDLLVDNNLIFLYRDEAVAVYPINPKVSLMVIPGSKFDMTNIGTYPYSAFPSLFTLSSETCTFSNVEKIQSNPNFALFGQGVLVGIIDTGIDYRHPSFRHPDGSSRIYSLWDQTINDDGAIPPLEQFYGAEYSNEIINQALLLNNPLDLVPSTDEIGHGTMMAGIAGGNSEIHHGIVPFCEFIIVKLKPAKKYNKKIFCVPENKLCYEETDVITALSYITETARILHRPLSICLPMGTSQGGHNGKGATSGFLNYITQSPHTGVAVSAGNEGSLRRHYLGQITQPYFTDFELNVDEKDPFFSMEIWGGSPYRLMLEITSPNGEVLRSLYPKLRECRKLDFIFIPTVIWFNNIVAESDTGDQMILFRFENAVKGIWRFRVVSIDEEPAAFHVWLPADHLISLDTFFLDSDSETTITSPGNAESPLVVTNLNEATGSVLPSSSRGYTRYHAIKPDLAAPGTNIPAPMPNQSYGEITGTGAAAAHAAGVIAMVLEWAVIRGRYSVISGSDINRMLIRGAFRSRQITYPNTTSGYGTLDIQGLFEKLV